jgi:hypothetical protein
MKRGTGPLAAVLSRFLGGIAVLAGIALITLANILWSPIAQGFSRFADGLYAAHDAVEAISSGVSSSSTMVSRIRLSILTTSQVVTDTRNVLSEVGYVTEELREMSLLAIEDLESLGAGLSALIGHNNFYDIAERLGVIYERSGDGMIELEQLTGTLEELEDYLVDVALAVESLETDLFSTEAAFGEANIHLERAAGAAESAVSSRAILYAVDATGILIILAGVYLIILGRIIGRLPGELPVSPEDSSPPRESCPP